MTKKRETRISPGHIMDKSHARAQLDASKEALKVIYYVIIGLAITQSLDRVFLSNGSFVSATILDQNHLPSVLLLLSFLPTVTRFVHGASIHFDVIHTGNFKVLFDFCGFFVQASLFYLMALSIHEGAIFAVLFAIMLLADVAWLCILLCVGYVKLERVVWQWIVSNLSMVAIFVVVWQLFDRSMASVGAAAAILVASWVAAVADYGMNRRFYFPTEERARRRVWSTSTIRITTTGSRSTSSRWSGRKGASGGRTS
jgi:hypothetical protein